MKVLLAGTFDHFHIGHQFLLWKSLLIGEHITIIIARDKTVEKIKKQKSIHSEQKRLTRVKEEFKYLKKSSQDSEQNKITNIEILLGNKDGNVWETIKNINPDMIHLGYDQFFNEQKCKALFPNIKITRASAYAPQFFKSSKFRV